MWGLAEGTHAWIEEDTGWHRREPFFDGTVVNRIADIPERIIQTGSRNGTNSGGGPGYTFMDEFHPSLSHEKAGILSMANSGPHSNGSQYFFTLGPLLGLDNRHAVFGEVIAGLNVLEDIGDVPLAGSKPVDDVFFERVSILRVGLEASSFDVSAQGVPEIHETQAEILFKPPNQVEIGYAVQSNSEHVVHVSSDLDSSLERHRELNAGEGMSTTLVFAAEGFSEVYSVSQVVYQQPIYTPNFVGDGRFLDTEGVLDNSAGPRRFCGYIDRQ